MKFPSVMIESAVNALRLLAVSTRNYGRGGRKTYKTYHKADNRSLFRTDNKVLLRRERTGESECDRRRRQRATILARRHAEDRIVPPEGSFPGYVVERIR